jgi:hypothetical protein
MKKWPIPTTLVTVAGVAIWWDNGGQSWAAHQTGTYCGATGTQYCYWSGFGSVMPWVLLTMGGIFAGIIGGLRAINCHEKGCPLIGRYPIADGRFKYCGKHHPDWKGKHPPREHILGLHRAHREQAGLLNEIHKHVTATSPGAGDFPPRERDSDGPA